MSAQPEPLDLFEECQERVFPLIREAAEKAADEKEMTLAKAHRPVDRGKILQLCEEEIFQDINDQIVKDQLYKKNLLECLRHEDSSVFHQLEAANNQIEENFKSPQAPELILEPITSQIRDAIYQHGITHFQKGQFDKSLIYFRYLTILEADNRDLWLVRGITAYNLANYSEAEECYNVYIALLPSDFEAYLYLIECLYKQEKKEEAKKLFLTLIDQVPMEEKISNPNLMKKFQEMKKEFALSN